MQFAQVLPGFVQSDPGMQPFGEVGAQRGRSRQAGTQDLEFAQGANCEVGAGLVPLRAVVGKPVDILLARLDDRRAGIKAGHLRQQSIRELLDHGGNSVVAAGPWIRW